MLSYLEKFNDLSQDLKDKISEPGVMAAIDELEKKYMVNLATVIMRVMVRDLSLVDLPKFFVFEHNMEGKKSEEIVDELKEKVFFKVADYLGFELEGQEANEQASDQLDPQKTVPVHGSNFFFSSEDEEEVKELAKKLGTAGVKIKQDSSSEQVNEIIRDMQIQFSASELNDRLRMILKTFIKGVRNKIDAKLALTKEVKFGGLGFDVVEADEILRKAESFRQGSEGGGAKSAVKPKTSLDDKVLAGTGRDIDYDLSKMPKKTEKTDEKLPPPPKENAYQKFARLEEARHESSVKIEKQKKKMLNKSLGLEDVGRIITKTSKPAPGSEEAGASEEKTNKIAKNDKIEIKTAERKKNPPIGQSVGPLPKNKYVAPAKAPVLRGGEVGRSGKVKMEDVKKMPVLTGPVEELLTMSLVDFRRLSNDPNVAADKIKSKIDLLEDEDYLKKDAGVKAWRRSPLNKIYLEIGKNSIESKKTINKTIEDMPGEEENKLSSEEFEAILDLNRSLRF